MHNWKFLLTSQLARGHWFMNPHYAQAGMADVANLLNPNHNHDTIASGILSESKPFEFLASTHDDNNVSDGFDSLPEGSIAIVKVTGTLLKYGTYCSYGTEEIGEHMLYAAGHKNIAGMLFVGDSGGGGVNSVSPMRNGVAAFKNLGKPVLSLMDTAYSAMYYAISESDHIMAANDISSGFGSIGVMLSYLDMTKYMENLGIEQISLYPDESSEKNLAFEKAMKKEYDMIRNEELSPMAIRFQNTVIADRGIKLKHLDDPKIIKGKTYSADEAIDNGLADSKGDRNKALDKLRDLIEVNNFLNSN
jgi:protease-4